MEQEGQTLEEDMADSRSAATALAVGPTSDRDHHLGSVSSAEAAKKKPRGRPQGSKNKPKLPVVITQVNESSMRPLVLELLSGSDVVEAVADFARRRHVSLSVLSGTGAVANVTLRHPTSLSATLTLHGCFDILSLSGTFLSSEPRLSTSSPSVPTPSQKRFPLIVSLAGAQGQVVGGAVVGPLLTATPVVLVAATFINPCYHRLPMEDEDEAHDMVRTPPSGGGTYSCDRSSLSAFGYTSVRNASPLTCQLSQDPLPWTASSRPSHY